MDISLQHPLQRQSQMTLRDKTILLLWNYSTGHLQIATQQKKGAIIFKEMRKWYFLVIALIRHLVRKKR